MILEILPNLQENICVRGLFFNEVAGLRSGTFLKNRLRKSFPVNFAKCLRTPFFIEHLLTTASDISEQRIYGAAVRYLTTASEHFTNFLSFQSSFFLFEANSRSLGIFHGICNYDFDNYRQPFLTG